ncbi:hypothetical protein [Notoacmeibacter sp. MSK16QG-6]|nr:hypothetical protein [Notoacmeibacter sp. MSK16QG-6]MCP1199094.1 hypothetical protein [Notoacmeibacter sp. MSK16QG-6]
MFKPLKIADLPLLADWFVRPLARLVGRSRRELSMISHHFSETSSKTRFA